ncbi:MAG: nitrate reductase, partial [Caulobacter sp. 12-67-6]
WITAGIGVLIMPWKLLETTEGYIFVWLVGYGALLGPIAGILIVDYWLLRKTRLAVADLYEKGGAYAYRGGWNPAALAALAVGVAPNLPGFLASAAPHLFGGVGAFWTGLYTYAWFVGLALAGGIYWGMMRSSLARTGD